MGLFNKCTHKWEIVTDKFIESNLERIKKINNESGTIQSSFGYSGFDLQAIHIIILKCEKCGKLDKTITKT